MGKRRTPVQTEGNTDFVPERVYCVGYLFDLEVLEEEADSSLYSTPIVEKLMDSFLRLSKSGNKRLRETDFLVFGGDYFGGYKPFFIIAVLDHISVAVTEFLRSELHQAPGFETMEMLFTDEVMIIPLYRYEKGQVIQYGEYEMAGQTVVDERTGLSVLMRDRVPSS